MQTLPRSIHKDYFLVKISREEQKKKRASFADGSSLVSNPMQVFLKRNQQCGKVVRIGSKVASYFPEVWLGDTLIFHHSIEGSMDDRGGDKVQAYNNSRFLLLQDEQFNYYMVHQQQTYAVEKMAAPGFRGEIIMAPDWLFCRNYSEEKDERKLVTTESGLLLFENWKPTKDEERQKLKRMEKEIESLSKSGVGEKEGLEKHINKRREEVAVAIQEKMNEMGKITKSLMPKQVKPYISLCPNKTFNEDCGNVIIDESYVIFYNQVGDDVTTINYRGTEFCILKTSQVFYVQQK